jgi:hypothetical protein
VDAPEIVYWLDEFDLDVSLYGWKISRAGHSANDITPLRVRNDDRLAGRKIACNPQNRSVVEHNHSSGFFPVGLG